MTGNLKHTQYYTAQMASGAFIIIAEDEKNGARFEVAQCRNKAWGKIIIEALNAQKGEKS